MPKFAPVHVKPTQGGRLMSGVSSDTAGLANYAVKRDFRRDRDREVLAEGYEEFLSDSRFPVPLDAGESVTLITMARRQDNRTTIVVGTPARLWAYFPNEGGYIEIWPDDDYVKYEEETDPPAGLEYMAGSSPAQRSVRAGARKANSYQ
jgi:hypothetical protein